MGSHYEELHVNTMYDEKDLISVRELYIYDEDGEEVVAEDASAACDGLCTCADQDIKGHEALKQLVEHNLKIAGITFEHLVIDDHY